MVRPLVIAIVCAGAVAHADSAKLAAARDAVAAVDYGTAQRLLVEALDAGGCSVAEVAEIYKLSARAAIVLGQRDVGEQYYRRWLAIDPGAALPDDTAPKLRDPFVAARAYVAAQGRLAGRVDGDFVIVTADPLAMAHAIVVGTTAIPLAADRRAELPKAAIHAAVVDEHGNHLLELETAARPVPQTPPEQLRDPKLPPERPWTRRWITWAIPTGLCLAVSAGFGIAAIAENDNARQIANDSATHFYSDVGDAVHTARVFTVVSAITGAAAIGFAIPTTILFFHERGERGAGAAIAGRF